MKLGQRGISTDEVVELLRNVHVTTRNPRGHRNPERRLLIGHTDGGRTLTVVVEPTVDPTTWVVITGWLSTTHERKMLED